MRKPCRICGGEKPRGPGHRLCATCPRSRNRTAERMRDWRAANRDKMRATAAAHPERTLYYHAKARAKKQGMAFELKLVDIVVPLTCPVLAIKLRRGPTPGGRAADDSPTLDRLDNTKGYVAGNVHVVSWRASRIKCDATLDELRAIVRYMESNR